MITWTFIFSYYELVSQSPQVFVSYHQISFWSSFSFKIKGKYYFLTLIIHFRYHTILWEGYIYVTLHCFNKIREKLIMKLMRSECFRVSWSTVSTSNDNSILSMFWWIHLISLSSLKTYQKLWKVLFWFIQILKELQWSNLMMPNVAELWLLILQIPSFSKQINDNKISLVYLFNFFFLRYFSLIFVFPILRAFSRAFQVRHSQVFRKRISQVQVFRNTDCAYNILKCDSSLLSPQDSVEAAVTSRCEFHVLVFRELHWDATFFELVNYSLRYWPFLLVLFWFLLLSGSMPWAHNLLSWVTKTCDHVWSKTRINEHKLGALKSVF